MATNQEAGKWIVEAFEAAGIDVDSLCELLPGGLPRLVDQPERVTTEEINNLLLEAERRAADQDLGLHLAQYSNLRSMGIYGYLLLNAETLYELLELAGRYYATIYQTAQILFTVNAGVATLEYKPLVTGKLSSRHDTEWTLGFFVYLIRSVSNSSWQPARSSFAHAEPADSSLLHQVFGVEVSFNQPRNRLEFDAELLSLTFNDSDRELLQVVKASADRHLRSYTTQNSLESHVRLLIMKDISQEGFGIDSVARQLGMSVSTFQRRLRRGGRNYRDLREEVVLDLAKQALAETDSPISQIAFMLGYSEISAFDHAYHRMTGSYPRAYRNKARASYK
jgi:AraC-like DNA-binding protein